MYAGISFNNSYFFATALDPKKNKKTSEKIGVGVDLSSTILAWARDYERVHKVKFVAIGVAGEHWEHIASRLWLEADIAPCRYEDEKVSKKVALDAAYYASSVFNKDNSYTAKIGKENQVVTDPLVTLADYEATTPVGEFRELLTLAKKFRGKRMTFFSATPQGGGVAIMRHAMMRLYEQLGLTIKWHVMEDDAQLFDITKRKFHNVLQEVAPPGITLTDREKELYNEWSSRNAEIFAEVIKKSDVVVIDDPQPAGMIPHVKKMNPRAKIVYRSHIHLSAKLADKPGTSQHVTWSFLWEFIKHADLFVAHPVRSFVPKGVDPKKLVYMPPSTDPLDGLNKELTDNQKHYYMNLFDKYLKRDGQEPMDLSRPFITQIARFDPSKGIPDLLTAYFMLCRKCDKKRIDRPQLVIVGNGSVDDPDGIPVLNMVREILTNKKNRKYAKDVKVSRLPHYDQLLNTLMREAYVGLQLSHKEGFEFKIVEGLMKGKPMVIYDSGGMPLQVNDGSNGFVVKRGDVKAVAEKLFELLSSKTMYQKMHRAANNTDYNEFMTVRRATNWLLIADKLTSGSQLSLSERTMSSRLLG